MARFRSHMIGAVAALIAPASTIGAQTAPPLAAPAAPLPYAFHADLAIAAPVIVDGAIRIPVRTRKAPKT